MTKCQLSRSETSVTHPPSLTCGFRRVFCFAASYLPSFCLNPYLSLCPIEFLPTHLKSTTTSPLLTRCFLLPWWQLIVSSGTESSAAGKPTYKQVMTTSELMSREVTSSKHVTLLTIIIIIIIVINIVTHTQWEHECLDPGKPFCQILIDF